MSPALAALADAVKAITRPALPEGYSPAAARAEICHQLRLLVEVYPRDNPRAVALRAALASSDPVAVDQALSRRR